MSGEASRGKSVYTIPPGMPFVDTLAAGILERAGPAPEALTDVTVLLPTRRACRSLGDAFLRLSGGRPMLLPVMTPLGDLDAEELELSQWEDEGALGLSADLPPAVSGLRRQLLLTRLVFAFEERALDGTRASPEQAAGLAAELARLIDQVETERLDFGALENLVPFEKPRHWEKVLEFLSIATEMWPAVLAEEAGIDPSRRRNLLLETQAKVWRDTPPRGPVIAAGSTGTIPATADLLEVVAELDQGAVVLPGLDRSLDDASWQAVDVTHPQYGVVRLLVRLGVSRADVMDWVGNGKAPARVGLLSEALRPAPMTHLWAEAEAPPVDAIEGLSRIDCPSPREEAGAIALMMREVLETPGQTAALVTPDRRLARRVAAELGRWGVEVDDTAGCPLAETPPGIFLRLAADCLASDVAPVPLLSLLGHPLAAGGEEPAAFRARTRRLNVHVLRGPRPAPGFEGLARTADMAATGTSEDLTDLAAWIKGLDEMARPFARLLAKKGVLLGDLLAAHVAFAEALAATAAEPGMTRLWVGDDGESLAAFVAEVLETGHDFPPIKGADYPGLLTALMTGRVVRPRFGRHPRLAIWGLLEARLQQADLLILASLNEGTWPPEVKTGPWMSRPMQKTFGLPLPERRVGLSAHDFAQAAAAPRVVLTRAVRVDGTPTLPSRWLMRLDNLLGGHGMALPSAGKYLEWADKLDESIKQGSLAPPRPAPPLEARPNRLSVTRVETWIRDPYALYAEQVLGLRPFDPLDADPGAAERGSIIHAALERFVAAYPDALPDDALTRLIDIGRDMFGDTLARPGVRAFWWPRFRRIADWFVDHERRRREESVSPAAVEVSGRLELPVSGCTFTLTAKADRIDRLPCGGLAIVDYKTGIAPTAKQVRTGLAPQLSLEGAMVAAGAFDGLAAGTAADLVYLRLSGGRVVGEVRAMGDETPEVCRDALEGLKRRVAAYWNPDVPYLSRPRPMFAGRFSDYDHLARVLEWSVGGEDGK